jgi:tetratricopeptide (TPR) repeat protein
MSMARTLSRIAHAAIAVFTTVCVSLAADSAFTQEQPPASEQARVIKNPFLQGNAPQATSEAQDESGLIRRRSAAFRNPFSSASTSPPLAIPLRPGPISRWQRGTPLIEQPSAVANAILATVPEPVPPMPTAHVMGTANLAWDRLPPVEELAEREGVRTTSIAVPIDAQTPKPPDPVAFAPSQLTQPVWMVPNLVPEQPTSTVEILPFQMHPAPDPFEVPAGKAPGNEAPPQELKSRASQTQSRPSPNRRPAPTVVQAAGLQLAMPAALEPMPVAQVLPSVGDMLPVIVSDYVDTADGWCAEAEQAAQAAKTIDEFSAVIELCQQSFRNQPSAETANTIRRLASWAHNRRGEILADNQRPLDALAEFEMAISFDAESSVAIHNRAVTLAQQDRPADALRDFNRVVELNPGLAVAYRNRAELLASLGRMEEALRDYNWALEQLPDDAELLCARAYAWQQLGQLDRALEDLNQAIRLSPANPDSYTQRASLAVSRGNFGQAVRDLQRSIQLDPALADAHRSLAWLLATCPDPQFRDPQQAIERARQGLAVSAGPNPFLLDALAAAQASAGDFSAAVETIREAIKIAPTAAPLHARLAMYQQRQPFVERTSSGVRPASFDAPAANSLNLPARRR